MTMADAQSAATTRLPPPWDWTGLPADELAARLRSVAKWVAWLVDNYGDWVDLPACWPLHELLRAELTFFCYWHRRILAAGTDASEGVRWHLSLRFAAGRWRELSNCRHDDNPARSARLEAGRRVSLQGFLAQVPDLADGDHR